MDNYMIGLGDNVTQEPIIILAHGEKELEEVLKMRPEHHVLSNVQNIGPLESAKDYILRVKQSERS